MVERGTFDKVFDCRFSEKVAWLGLFSFPKDISTFLTSLERRIKLATVLEACLEHGIGTIFCHNPEMLSVVSDCLENNEAMLKCVVKHLVEDNAGVVSFVFSFLSFVFLYELIFQVLKQLKELEITLPKELKVTDVPKFARTENIEVIEYYLECGIDINTGHRNLLASNLKKDNDKV